MTGQRPIIFFGSSMNPPTLAHKALVMYLLNLTKTLEPRPLILIAPVYEHLFSKADLADFPARLELTKVQFQQGIEEGNIIVSDLEEIVYKDHKANPAQPIGSIDILRYIKSHPELLPEANVNHISFVLGGDTFKDFIGGLWKEAENIIKLCDTFHVFGRGGVEVLTEDKTVLQITQDIKKSLEKDINQDNTKSRLEKLDKIISQLKSDSHKFISHLNAITDPSIQKISSTKIRQNVEDLQLGVDEPVLRLILNNYPDLYQSTKELYDLVTSKSKGQI